MKKWLKYIIPGESLEDKVVDKIDNLEKTVEQELPKPINKEAKRHYLLYIFGSVLIIGLVSFFFYSYSEQVKKSQELTQKQIELQQQQLDLQAKQIEDNKIKATPTPTPSVYIPAKTSASKTPSCDKTRQERQRKFVQALIDKAYTSKVTAQANLAIEQAKLTNQNLRDYEREFIEGTIGKLTMTISDAETNSNNYKQALDSNISKCNLYKDSELEGWGKVLGVTY